MNLDDSFKKFQDSFTKDVKLSNYSWFTNQSEIQITMIIIIIMQYFKIT